MKLSELALKCEYLVRKHGDIEVAHRDADTSWTFKITDQDFFYIKGEGGIEWVEIGPDYNSERLQ